MIAESYNLMVSGACSNGVCSFSIGQNVDMTPLNFVSVNRIVFPKNIYQIQQQFTMTITQDTNTYVVTFYPGNIQFSQIISKIQEALGNNYVVQELYSNLSQESAKLQIYEKTNLDFDIVISNSLYQPLFGFLEKVGVQWISSVMCNLLNSTLVVVRSSLVSSVVPQFTHADVLYSFSIDTSLNYQFYQEANVDIIQNKQPLVRNREFTIYFEDQYHQPIIFQNGTNYFIGLTLFHYKIKYIDYLQNNLQKLLNVYVYKNFKKEIQEDQNQENVLTSDHNNDLQNFMNQIKAPVQKSLDNDLF